MFISGAILVLHFHFRGIFVSKLFFGFLFHNSGSNWDFSFFSGEGCIVFFFVLFFVGGNG